MVCVWYTAVTSHTRGSSGVSAEHVRMCCSPMPWRCAPEDRNKTGEGKNSLLFCSYGWVINPRLQLYGSLLLVLDLVRVPTYG